MFFKRLRASSIGVAALACQPALAIAGDFAEPPVFASANGLLDILMIARPQQIPSISFTPPGAAAAVNPTGWIYEVCQRANATGNQCPADSATVSNYGGIRLALQKGDLLKVRLINQLPKLDPVKVTHSVDPGGANLPLNLTNFHTHGLIVQARAPSVANPTFGDDIFVEIYNSENGAPTPQLHQHGSIVKDYVDYQIAIPLNHPSGSFWFHPHVHGIAGNQVTSGLAGIISIGQVGDYAHGDAKARFPEQYVRHLILKDMEVFAAGEIAFSNGEASVANGEVYSDGPDPVFCNQYPAGPGEIRQGSCPGVDNTSSGGNNYVGGQWYFTVSGQQYPTIRITEPDGEIWRLTNASASASYDLQLADDVSKAPILMQLVSVDGVSIHVPPSTPPGAVVEMSGARFKIAACPLNSTVDAVTAPVCVSQFVMMPSARAELWVAYRDQSGRVVAPPPGTSATLKTIGITTGVTGVGDPWPAVDLAKVLFTQTGLRFLKSSALSIAGDALAANQPTGIFSAPVPDAQAAPLPAGCKALATGHRRRIFYGLVDPYNRDDLFGLGYEELDQNGAVVPGTQVPVSAFDPSKGFICLPLGRGQIPVHETWELVNLATENHNFHIHQTKFRLVQTSSAQQSPALAAKSNPALGAGIMEDNVPLPIAIPNTPDVANNQNGYCTIDQWRNGQCVSPPVVVDIPFSQLGEFVYHCHILEHEDGGMMAKIRVVPAPF